MTNTILGTMPATRQPGPDLEGSTAPQAAARFFGVEIASEHTEVNATIGALNAFAQIWWTKCGKLLVIDETDDFFRAALCESPFDWDFCAYKEERNYGAISKAAGLTDPESDWLRSVSRMGRGPGWD